MLQKTVKYHQDNHYLLLTPGPLTTSHQVKAVMSRDWCTWDDDYNALVQEIRQELVRLSGAEQLYTATLMQGSGTASVESVIGSVIPKNGKLAVLRNGEYGHRIQRIAETLNIPVVALDSGELQPVDVRDLEELLKKDPDITHVAAVHCETTTGMLNPIQQIGEIAKKYQKVFILDGMSSFGGIPMDLEQLQVDFLISSANKCIQGVPGFGFILSKREALQKTKGWARSLSLDLYDQWNCMEENQGKWRFTSPTHVVRAFAQALSELKAEGGISQRYQRYQQNQQLLVEGMRSLGFECLLDDGLHSPIITSFLSPKHPNFEFKTFYNNLKEKGFVIYPGKVSQADCFRIGNIGDIHPEDILRLIQAIEAVSTWKTETA
ncbi:MAG: 2-aminoethylphosphonate--pyruvate transaminase [SAR324 cluster bacterium]|uniref:2-aminoethylphosphonate--pyruvate transaminase n=1 Tax=SAR324 cluster bacterium TaxID=2024889 RepID=A0A2A4STC0_9DELT|nr:MAG: 2-aminoethylphosphonate--pyruvate transaminase [SAR324 cluster bacterium]